MCDEGDTPAFRPHSGRNSPFAFPGAEKFRSLSNAKDRWGSGHTGRGHYQTPDQWLTQLKPDVLVAFFGYNESFAGPAGVEAFEAELSAFVKHTLKQSYNGSSPPELVLVSPTAFQDLSDRFDTPKGERQNANLKRYSDAIRKVALANQIPFLDLFTPTKAWFKANEKPLTRDGALWTDQGYEKLAPLLADELFGQSEPGRVKDSGELGKLVQQKNWIWQNYYKIPNGVHVFGRRHRPYGPKNYPFELEKLKQMVAVRDQAIHANLAGESFDLAAADAETAQLPAIGQKKTINYINADEAVAGFQLPEGYRI
jgi:lysophospholipase L1-like esterase